MRPSYTHSDEFKAALQSRIQSLLQNPTPDDELIRMRLTAHPTGNNINALVDFHILCAFARHIGTHDPLSESNLRGICKRREEFESLLRQAQN